MLRPRSASRLIEAAGGVDVSQGSHRGRLRKCAKSGYQRLAASVAATERLSGHIAVARPIQCVSPKHSNSLARRADREPEKRTLLLLLRLAYGRGTHATPHVAGREVPNHLAVRGASHDGPPASLVGLIHADLTHAARLLFGFLGEGRSRQERGRNRRSDDRKNKLSDRVHRSPLLRRP